MVMPGMNLMMGNFKIDFFELCFLAEACIPPRPIARSMFWHRMIDVYYDQLSEDERERAFGWITKNPSFDLNNEDCKWFYDRYDPDNQYMVTSNFEGNINEHRTFLHDGRYYTDMRKSINEDYITSVKKVPYERS